jgi:hypothetical protein
MVDLARDPAFIRRRRWRRIAYTVTILVAVLAISIAFARMEHGHCGGRCTGTAVAPPNSNLNSVSIRGGKKSSSVDDTVTQLGCVPSLIAERC